MSMIGTVCTMSSEPLLLIAAILGSYAVLVLGAELMTPVRLDRKLLKVWLVEALVQSKQPHWSAPIFLVTLPLLYAFMLPVIYPFRAFGLACITGFVVINLCK